MEPALHLTGVGRVQERKEIPPAGAELSIEVSNLDDVFQSVRR